MNHYLAEGIWNEFVSRHYLGAKEMQRLYDISIWEITWMIIHEPERWVDLKKCAKYFEEHGKDWVVEYYDSESKKTMHRVTLDKYFREKMTKWAKTSVPELYLGLTGGHN